MLSRHFNRSETVIFIPLCIYIVTCAEGEIGEYLQLKAQGLAESYTNVSGEYQQSAERGT